MFTDWKLSDLKTPTKGKVFTCFAGGGGSSMGYKLAGFDVVGANEIDPRMSGLYRENLNPKYLFECPIEELLTTDLPDDLYGLEILDGSPPCSAFSVAGSREKVWGKKKKFREGQSEQILDELFFQFIALADRLRPKVVIAENVKGMLIGNAKDYVKRIYKDFQKIGYRINHYLINSQYMGVPQRRERVFFIAVREDIAGGLDCNPFTNFPEIDMSFHETPILFREIHEDSPKDYREVKGVVREAWGFREFGDSNLTPADIRRRPKHYIKRRLEKKGYAAFFNYCLIYRHKVCNTITGKDGSGSNILFQEPRFLSKTELRKASTFPADYNFLKSRPGYVCGMSVPPKMTSGVAERVSKYILRS